MDDLTQDLFAAGMTPAQLQADAALLRNALQATAPADLRPPQRGSRPLPPLAIAEGRTVPGWLLLAPAAAAALALVAGVWSLAAGQAPPPVSGVCVEAMEGAEWQQVVVIAADESASGPGGPMVDRLLDTVAPQGQGD